MPKVTEAHVEARRSQILNAACKCFSDKGFHQTTVRDICDRAGLSAGAVYGYFKSKDQILEAVGELGRENTRHALGLSEVDGAEPPSLAEILGKVMGFMDSEVIRQSSRLDVRMWGEALHTPQLRKLFLAAGANLIEPLEQAVRRGQEQGEITADLDPESVARVCVALALGFTVQAAMDPEADFSRCPAVVTALLDGSFAVTSAEQ
ncbi:MAG: TetR family transcriptional regulator [Gemmatimonadales bacterium]|jgi:AcrR family transcriptional regulator